MLSLFHMYLFRSFIVLAFILHPWLISISSLHTYVSSSQSKQDISSLDRYAICICTFIRPTPTLHTIINNNAHVPEREREREIAMYKGSRNNVIYRGFHEKGTLSYLCPWDRQIVSIERVYTPSTFYMKSAVEEKEMSISIFGNFMSKKNLLPLRSWFSGITTKRDRTPGSLRKNHTLLSMLIKLAGQQEKGHF